jgi:GNAT superfamily N-acetyltransferase
MIVPLTPTERTHARVVLALVVQSCLDDGDLDADPRLLAWQRGEGHWAVALTDQGAAAGIACVVRLDETGRPALLWLEVLPEHQRQGYGSALLEWAGQQADSPLVIRSTGSALGFYRQHGLAA